MRYLLGVQHRDPPIRNPPELLVYAEPSCCPYLPSETAQLPLRLPLRRLDGRELSRCLRAGDRRQGLLLYRPTCSACEACQAIRVDVRTFRPSKTQRRIFRNGEAQLQLEIRRPSVSAEKITLYNRHKIERHLLVFQELLDEAGYEQFLVESCTETIELCYRHEGKLVAVAVADRAADALSAVYCYFDPAYGRLSPGTYSILKEIELCRRWGLRYLYLGLYVAGCRPMEYKASYLPHERLVGGKWQRFARRDPA